jgi:putative alpha-1,2-mannosidase
MIGHHANLVIADAYFKGIRDFDLRKAFRAMKQGANENQRYNTRVAYQDYNRIGYVPSDVFNKL